MRVLIVNTSERNGGAAVAANRLMETTGQVVAAVVLSLGASGYFLSSPFLSKAPV